MVAAAISRFSWLTAAYHGGVAGSERTQEGITFTVETGCSNPDPARGDFWAYFHRPAEPSLLGISPHLLARAARR